MAESKTPVPAASSAFSITSLVTGITGLVFIWAPFFSIVLSILAIVFGGIALKRKNPGRGMAIAGLVTGIVAFALLLMSFIFVLIGVSMVVSAPEYYQYQ